MPCYFPIQGNFVDAGAGKRKFVPSRALQDLFFRGISSSSDQIPCGRCMGCRLERSRQWALRMYHESKSHDDNCFVTLTFDEDNLLSMCPNGSLDRKHVQDFLKRLRQRFSDRKIRVFYCGEYGEGLSRPHYHLCLFGLDFHDKKFYKTENGFKYYNSSVLSSLWPFGFSVVTSFSFETAAYVARYCMKKITGSEAEAHYQGRLPEFCGMSLKPGIGRYWFDKYGKTDVLPTDTCVVRGVQCKPPRYYDKIRDKADPAAFAKVKQVRLDRALEKSSDNTFQRLADKFRCASSKINLLVRKLEK